jgi:hypothetical protein
MDWSHLDRYAGFHKSEWCQDSPHAYARITDPLIAEDFVIKDTNGIQAPITLSTPTSAVHHANMRIWYQKNQNNYQVITYSAAHTSPKTCPIQAILCILKRGIHLWFPQIHSLAIRANLSDPHGFLFVTGTK